MAGSVATLRFDTARMAASAPDGFALATEIAEWLVQRAADDDDRRAQRVILTAAGAAVLEQARGAHQDALAYRVSAALSVAEQEQFHALLLKLHDSLVDTLDAMGQPVES